MDNLKTFFSNLENLFRYFFSGVLTILFFEYFYPECSVISTLNKFIFFYKSQYYFFVVSAALSSIIGIALYIINRYTLMVLFDYLYFIIGWSSFTPNSESWKRRLGFSLYHSYLSSYIEKRFDDKFYPPKLSSYLLMRRAHIHLLLVLFELSLFGWLVGEKIPSFLVFIILAFLIFQEMTVEQIERPYYLKAIK